METVQPKRLNLKSLDKLAKRGDNLLLLLVEDEEDAKAIQNCKLLVDAVFVFRLDPESEMLLEIFLSCVGDRKIDNFTFIFTVEGKLKSAVVISEDQHDKKIGIVPIPIIDLKPLNADNANDSSRKITKIVRKRVGRVLTFLSGQGDGLPTSMIIITPNTTGQLLSLEINPTSRDPRYIVNVCNCWEGDWIFVNTQTRYKIMGLLDPLYPPDSKNTMLKSKLKLAATGVISLGSIKQIRLIEHYVTNVSEGKYIESINPPKCSLDNTKEVTQLLSRNIINSVANLFLATTKTESGNESVTMSGSNDTESNVNSSKPMDKFAAELISQTFGNAFDSENKGARIEIDMNASDSEIYSIRNMISSFKLLQEDPELLKKEAIVLSHIRKVYEDSVKNKTSYYLPDNSKVLIGSVTTIDDIIRKSLNSEKQPANKPEDCIIS